MTFVFANDESFFVGLNFSGSTPGTSFGLEVGSLYFAFF